MVNCNPETVSTDYDTSDRLYFEPLTAEDVLEILRVEQSRGELDRRHRPVRRADPAQAGARAGGRGHSDPRHVARRDRPRRRSRTLRQAGQPARAQAAEERHRQEPRRGRRGRRADRLSGAAAAELRARRAGDGDRRFRGPARRLHPHRGQRFGRQPGAGRPVSARCDRVRRRCVVRRRAGGRSPACMQHIEEAGVHSGDSACTLPPYSLSDEIVAEMERQAGALAKALGVRRADERPVRGQGGRRST